MKIINGFNNFLVDLILEDEKKKFHGVTELPFVISHRLHKLLSTINHPIAKKIIQTDKEREDKKVTFVDYSNENDNKFSLVNSNKAFDNIEQEYGDKIDNLDKLKVSQQLDSLVASDMVVLNNYWTKNRAEVKIGSFIGKVYPNEFKQGGDPGQDIESFVQAVVAKRKSVDELKNNFKIVKGEDIKKYYNYSMNDTANDNGDSVGGPLAGSCMRYDKCDDYVDFYAQNEDVSMLVLFSDNEERKDKIIGRAILWELSSPSGRTFMDRIYYRYESDMAAFKQYAEKNGWLHKRSQSMSASEKIVDTKTGESDWMNLKTLSTFKQTSYYPYMDTMKWFYINDGYLTNDEDIIDYEEIYFLESTSGGYDDAGEEDHEGQTYVEYYDDWIDDDELIYCELGDEYRKSEDSTYCEYYEKDATSDYVDDNMVYSDYINSYLEYDDATHSDVLHDYILNDDVVHIYSGADGSFEDIYEEDDVTSEGDDYHTILYRRDNQEYHFVNEFEKYFVKVPINNVHKEHKHKVWDKDRLYKVDGEWYYEFDTKVKDQKTGQFRFPSKINQL